MPTFHSYDGTLLAYRLQGTGPLLVVVPGGPGRDSAYLGNLGGLDAYRTLVLLDNRGTGGSADASDVDSYRADRLAGDVEALRIHLGLETVDLLGHSGGAQICTWYAAAYPQQLSTLALITGGHRVAGAVIESARQAAYEARSGEDWYPEAKQALDEWSALGAAAPAALKLKAAPFYYGRPYTEAHRAHAATDEEQRRNPDTMAHFAVQPDPESTRQQLAMVTAPALLYLGEVDPALSPAEAELFATAFANARIVIQPDAGHFPWLDNPGYFVEVLRNHRP